MPKMITFKKIGNPEIGYLSFFESNKEVDFDVKRIYYTYDVPVGVQRGMHAHKELKQLVWCPYGCVEFILDNGKEKKTYILDKPNEGLYIDRGFWRDIYFKTEGSVLCVAVSDYYNEEDYIRSYEEFKTLSDSGYWNDENRFSPIDSE
jgi:dTDP-4-dehydrorhamnose 3,5-epimerase-like enzyme